MTHTEKRKIPSSKLAKAEFMICTKPLWNEKLHIFLIEKQQKSLGSETHAINPYITHYTFPCDFDL